MFLVDTNVISEARKGTKANAGVRQFFKTNDATDLYLSAQTIGEIRHGIENIRYRGDRPHVKKIEKWLDLVATDYAPRICPSTKNALKCVAE